MLQAKHIQKSYGSLTVLADVSFSLAEGQKVALVGDNGTGKTTLLKIIAGLGEPDAGEIELAKNTCIGYLSQDTSLTGDETISAYLRRIAGVDVLEKKLEVLASQLEDKAKFDEYGEAHKQYERLDGYAFEHRVKVMLAGFGLQYVGLDHRLSDLSSGQKSKVALAGILLKGVDLLLLDEPTNNLDLPALIWLEDFLRKSDAACIVISHDRRFLDHVVRKIFELDRNTRVLNISGGTYSDYLTMVEKRIARQKEEYRLQQEEIERLSDQARQQRAASAKGSNWQGSDNDKFLRGFKRDRAGGSGRKAKVIQKRIDQMEKVEKPIERDPFEIPLKAEVGPGTLDIRLVNVVAGYPNVFTIGPVSFSARYGSRIGIMGLNGTGKSTLLKTITGQLLVCSGTVEIGSGVKIGNMMQEHESLPRDQVLLKFFKERTQLKDNEIYNQLVKFGFDQHQAKQPISTLSPGGRARLLLALFCAQSVNVLVLDEPTNHLDLEALEALEETIVTYRGTVLLVSHDRYFLEKARLDSTYILSDGILTRIPDYKTYVAQAEERVSRLLKSL
jgi:ATPase subunit of ABC transporter with duplicated ATPase domains